MNRRRIRFGRRYYTLVSWKLTIARWEPQSSSVAISVKLLERGAGYGMQLNSTGPAVMPVLSGVLHQQEKAISDAGPAPVQMNAFSKVVHPQGRMTGFGDPGIRPTGFAMVNIPFSERGAIVRKMYNQLCNVRLTTCPRRGRRKTG